MGKGVRYLAHRFARDVTRNVGTGGLSNLKILWKLLLFIGGFALFASLLQSPEFIFFFKFFLICNVLLFVAYYSLD